MRGRARWMLALLAGTAGVAGARAQSREAGPFPARDSHPHHVKAKAKAKPASLAPTGPLSADERETIHIVRSGETLGGIAAHAGLARGLIIAANNLEPPYAVHPGQHLLIPHARRHVVAEGETTLDIAMQYGQPWAAIALANNIGPGARIVAGQKLVIPTVVPARMRHKDSPEAQLPDQSPAQAPAQGQFQLQSQAMARPPFAWPVPGEVVRGFAPRGARNHHDGVDIAAPEGTPVRASAAGTVIFAGVEPQRFGYLVVVDNRKPWQTVYGFLSKIQVTRGQSLRPGDRIGLVGHSGTAPRDELHFEIRNQGKPLNPREVLPPFGGRE